MARLLSALQSISCTEVLLASLAGGALHGRSYHHVKLAQERATLRAARGPTDSVGAALDAPYSVPSSCV